MSKVPGSPSAESALHPPAEAIRVSREPGSAVAQVLIARPEQGNAFTLEMVRSLSQALAQLAVDDAVKVIVIAGEGAHLTRGLDPAEAEALFRSAPGGASRKVPSQRARLAALHGLWWGPDGLYTRVLQCPKVTLLCAHGLCHEIGLYLALSCDLVLAGASAEFANPRWLHLGVEGDISMLVAAVGLKRAKELMIGLAWTAEQAHAHGLVDEVLPDAQLPAAAARLAATCSQVMRDGIAAEKQVVLASLAKMGVSAGFATANAVGAWASNVHFREGEFNFLREVREQGLEPAMQAAQVHFQPQTPPADDPAGYPSSLPGDPT